MKKLEVTVKDNIRSVVYMLLAAKERGERVYAEYNGKFFYSDTVKLSDIYILMVLVIIEMSIWYLLLKDFLLVLMIVIIWN